MGLKFNLTNLKNVFDDLITKVVRTTDKYAPEILAGAGISLMLGSTAWGISETFKVAEEIKEPDADKKKIFVKHYIGPAISSIAGATCIIMSVNTSNKRYLALASAYEFADETLRTYKQQVIETVGERKEKEIEGKVAQKRLEENPVEKNQVIITGKGKSLCYDSYSGRYFYFDIGKIQKVENELNNRMIQNNYVALNELYLELGIEPIDLGYDIGWNTEHGKLLEFELSSKLTKDDEPCLVINYNPLPTPEYDYFYK